MEFPQVSHLQIDPHEASLLPVVLPSVGWGICEGQSKENKIKGTKQKRLRIFTIEVEMKNLHVSENRRGRDWRKKRALLCTFDF